MVKRFARIFAVIVASAVVISVLYVLFIAIFGDKIVWVHLPIDSTPRKFQIALYSGFTYNEPVITIEHYLEGEHTEDYVLKIKNGVGIQEPQTYKLPKIQTGSLVIRIEINENEKSSVVISIDNADKLYRTGMLIYLTDNDHSWRQFNPETGASIIIEDKYIYAYMGEVKLCYYKSATDTQWRIINDAPTLKRVPQYEPPPYIRGRSNWQENEWIQYIISET